LATEIQNITATTAENAYESADSGGMYGVDLAITNYRKATVAISDSQWHSSSVADISRFSNQLSASVATAFTTQIFGLINSSNYSSAVTGLTASSFGLAGVRSARLALTQNNAPREERCIVLNPTAYNSVLSDLSNSMLYGSPELGVTIQEGGVIKVYGMTIYEAPTLPSTGGLIGFAATPQAMAVAIRPLMPQDVSLYLECRIVTEKGSGLAGTYRRHFSPALGRHFATFEALTGFNVGVTSGLVRLTT
jgi:hypothetical protein